jgi:predicted RND superfamily exporter protein
MEHIVLSNNYLNRSPIGQQLRENIEKCKLANQVTILVGHIVCIEKRILKQMGRWAFKMAILLCHLIIFVFIYNS